MKKLIILLFIFIASCTLQVSMPIETLESDMFKYDPRAAYDSVGMVSLMFTDSKDVAGIGSAFAYDNDTLITAGHVCSAITNQQILGVVTKDIWIVSLGRNDKLYRKNGATISALDIKNDICVLKLKNHGLKPIRLGKYKNVKLGNKVFIVGAPSGFMISITEGMVMNRRVMGSTPMLNKKLLVSAAAMGGLSGAPVLSAYGEVIGVLVMGHKNYDHLSFCTPVSNVKRLLKKIRNNK